MLTLILILKYIYSMLPVNIPASIVHETMLYAVYHMAWFVNVVDVEEKPVPNDFTGNNSGLLY